MKETKLKACQEVAYKYPTQKKHVCVGEVVRMCQHACICVGLSICLCSVWWYMCWCLCASMPLQVRQYACVSMLV